MATVLIAALGDSPVVITSMLDRLQAKGKQDGMERIDILEVLCPAPDESETGIPGYDLIAGPIKERYLICKPEPIVLAYTDMNEEVAVYHFLHTLYKLLDMHQKQQDVVYLSLASGRKGMSALMALLAPLFPCVQKLYHILDRDEGKRRENFLTTRQLSDMSPSDQRRLLFPPLERVNLIDIPYDEKQRLSEPVKSLLYNITEQQIDELWQRDPQEAQRIAYFRQMTANDSRSTIVNVELTKEVIARYREMRDSDATHARNVAICFEQMHYTWFLKQHSHESYAYKGLHFHYYKRARTAERPVFHTVPVDIKGGREDKIEKVIVSALPIEVEGRRPPYPPLEQFARKLRFPLETEKLEAAFPQARTESEECILLIPLATTPMVATQLYQLYRDQGYKVHSVILLHTQDSRVLQSVTIVCDAFKSANVACYPKPLETWKDIDTSDACVAYQALLEQTIRETRAQHRSCQLELTISGGRKAMAALALLAAQRQGMRHVVHTLVHERIREKVEEETTIEELQKLVHTGKTKTRNDRLFLRDCDYQDEKEKGAFALFQIPVLPAQKG